MRVKRYYIGVICAVIGSLLLGAASVSASSLSTTTLVTGGLDTKGASVNAYAGSSNALSEDGRILVFASAAANLVPGDTNAAEDIFAYDRITQKTERLSVGVQGEQADGSSYAPSVSADGKRVVFLTQASNLNPDASSQCLTAGCFSIILHDRSTSQNTLVNRNTLGLRIPVVPLDAQISGNGNFVVFTTQNPVTVGDTNGEGDIVIRDLAANVTRAVSVDATGNTGQHSSRQPTVSNDGRFVAFSTRSVLVPDDTRGFNDVYMRDMQTGTIRRMSITTNDKQASESSFGGAISADGKSVAFLSAAANLVPHDTNARVDVFVRDWQAHKTTRVSIASDGTEANEGSYYQPSISSDGRYIVFTSYASNLVGADVNGSPDVFIYYRNYGITRRVDRASYDGAITNLGADSQAVSGNGKVIVFSSASANLAPIHPVALNIYLTYNPVVDIPFYDPLDFLDI
jgi:Tol biopolymer transport system component